MSIPRLIARLALAAGVAGAILGGPGPALADACPTANPPNELTLVGGSPQTAKLREVFGEPLQVALANTNGCPVTTEDTGVAVTFTAPATGATGAFSASGSNIVTVGTNVSGQASAAGFTANSNAGSYTVNASSGYGSISFSLANTASGIAATITPGTSTSQSATVGGRYAQPLQATVLDANGNPIDGATVTFTLGTSGGAGAGAGAGAITAAASFDGGAGQVTELTNAAGTATSPLFTANTTAGTFTATAATAGVVEPAGFTLDNLAGIPPRITALAPAKQTAAVGARYRPLRVKVLDGSGNPLQGATVTFTLGSAASGSGAGGTGSGSAGASFAGGSSQATATTNASGMATSPPFSANTTAGRFTATAATTGTNAVASFSLDNLAGRSPTIAAAGTVNQSTTVGSRYSKPLQVKVRDARGKPLQGASVTFTVGATDGSAGSTGTAGASFVGGGSEATETTNAAGIAISPHLTADTTAGSFTAIATITGTTRAASFPLHNLSAKPATIAAGVAASESATVGTQFPIRLAVTVSDKYGNPVAGVTVSFSAPAHGASGHFVGKERAETDAKGVAVAPRFVANRTQGGYVVRASAAGHTAAFALVNQPAA